MIPLLLFGAGLVALVAGAELLVRGASRLALALGLSPLVVGLTVVAFGTSAPEMAVSVGAVLDGRTDLALGNAVGSNIVNVLGILGVAALVRPLTVKRQVLRQDVPMMLAASGVLVLMCQDGRIGFAEGGLLFTGLLAYTAFTVVQSRRRARASTPGEQERTPGRWWWHAALALGGLALLLAGSQAMVSAAVEFAQVLGLSEVVIGLTVVAVGTSLPEVAASVTAVLRGQRDLAVGNVVGSCLFNVLGVIGLAALAAGPVGLAVPDAVRHFDLWVMLAAVSVCLPVFYTGHRVARWEGALLLGYYAAYTVYLVLQAEHHAALQPLSTVMMGFVMPLTALVLLATVLSRARPSG